MEAELASKAKELEEQELNAQAHARAVEGELSRSRGELADAAARSSAVDDASASALDELSRLRGESEKAQSKAQEIAHEMLTPRRRTRRAA